MNGALKSRLASRQAVMGSLAFLSSPDVVEVLAVSGFDYIIVDLEHSPTTTETAIHMIRAAQVHGMTPLVRVSENSEKLILKALEMGAEGIVVPFVQSAEDVARAARAVRYPPLGVRGTCTASRSSRYGTLRPQFAAHTKKANDSVLLVALIEDMAGVRAIKDIVACEPGVDVVLVGRSDLSASIGQIGQADHPEVMNATTTIIQAANQASRPVAAGIVLGSLGETEKWMTAGCRFITYGTDSDLVLDAATRARRAFDAAAGKG